jgi:hypothetical protein
VRWLSLQDGRQTAISEGDKLDIISEGGTVQTIRVSTLTHGTQTSRTHDVGRRQAVVSEHGWDTSCLVQRVEVIQWGGKRTIGEEGDGVQASLRFSLDWFTRMETWP